jgi:hypothetical protein
VKSLRYLLLLLLIFGTGDAIVARTPAPKDKSAPTDAFPTFDLVKTTVEQHFASIRGYQQNDLLTASMVEPVFAKLEKINWHVSDRKDIVKSVLPDADWMARQLTARSAKRFMREIAELPLGYDRVDHFRRMPYGQRRLVDMIRSPGGSKMFEYMATTQGGKSLTRMMTRDVNGADFNKPTGKIYTELDLLKRLKKSYETEAVRRLQIEPGPETKPGDPTPPKPDMSLPGAPPQKDQPHPPEGTDPFATPHG